MMALEILLEWLASLAEVLLFFYVIDSISDRRFTKGKQGRFTFIVAGFVAFGVILMNLAKLSISFEADSLIICLLRLDLSLFCLSWM